MTNLEKIKTLIKHVDKSDSIHTSYKIIDDKFVHLAYGVSPPYKRKDVWTEKELDGVWESVVLAYANQMRVASRIVRMAFDK